VNATTYPKRYSAYGFADAFEIRGFLIACIGFEPQPFLPPVPGRSLVNLLPSPERVKDETAAHQRDFALLEDHPGT
jgi:hypothetical protein